MRTFNQQIATSHALNASFVSDFVPLKNILLYSITAIVAGIPTGTITLEASNDPETNDTQVSTLAPTHFVMIEDSDFVLSAAGNTMWNVRDIAYNYVRVRYVDSSSGASTATMSIVFNGKGL